MAQSIHADKQDPKKKEAIVRAAMTEFGEKGFIKGSTDEIAKLAGVSKGTVFNYFGSKKKLFVSAVDVAYSIVIKEYNIDAWNDAADFADLIVRSSTYKMQLERKFPIEFKVIVRSYSELLTLPKDLQEKLQFLIKNSIDLGQQISAKILKNMDVRDDIPYEMVNEYATAMMGAMLNLTTKEIQKNPGEIVEVNEMGPLVAKIEAFTDMMEHGIVRKKD